MGITKSLNFENLVIRFLNQNTSAKDLEQLLIKLKKEENLYYKLNN